MALNRNTGGFIGRDMAVDLGTANTLVYVRGKGIVLDEPSVVAMNTTTGEVLAVGHEAKRMIGRTPDNIAAIRPLKDGVIADFEATEQMLRYFIHQVHRRRYFAKPRMVICVPSGITAVEQRAVKEAGYQAGARRVYIVEEPMAAAIGAGLPVHEATGNMIVDVGGGTTEVAVISLGGIVTSLSIRTAGDDLDQAIIAWMKKEYSLMLGERTAEEMKMTLGSAFPLPSEPDAEIRGRDMVSGLPRTVVVSSSELRQALEEPLHNIIDAVRTTLDQTPPELAGDIMDRGIVLTGGGAMLRGLDERLRHETGMPVHVAEDPLSSVAYGAGKCVEEFEALQQVLVSDGGSDGLRHGGLLMGAFGGHDGRERRWTGLDRLESRNRAAALAAGRAGARQRHPRHPRRLRRRRARRSSRPAARSARRSAPPSRPPLPPYAPSPPCPPGSAARATSPTRSATSRPATPTCAGQVELAGFDRNRLEQYDGLTTAAADLGSALVPGPGGGRRLTPVAELHRHHRRRLRRRRRPGHDGRQQRRPGRPRPARHAQHRDRPADRRPRLDGRRPRRLEHGDRLRQRQRLARPGGRARPAPRGRRVRPGARRHGRDVGEHHRPLRAGRADRHGSPRSTARCARPPSGPSSSRSSTSPPSTWSA